MLRSNNKQYVKGRFSGSPGTGLARALSKLGFCSRSQAWDFCGTHLCLDCYGTRGACCPEFGAEDLTDSEETGETEQKTSNAG